MEKMLVAKEYMPPDASYVNFKFLYINTLLKNETEEDSNVPPFFFLPVRSLILDFIFIIPLVFISFTTCVCACVLSHFCHFFATFMQFFVTLWTVAYPAPLSMGFSRQEFWRTWVAMPSSRVIICVYIIKYLKSN